MNTLQCIQNRVSVRSFLSKDVEREKLEVIAKAGFDAPTAKNTRQIALTVVKGETLSKINDAMERRFSQEMRENFVTNGRFNFYRGGNALIVVSLGRGSIMPEQNTGCIMENMYLAATELGRGACWINQFYGIEEGEIIDLLQLEDGYRPFAALSVGYIDKMPSKLIRDGKLTFLD